jgi:hypothetical protein
MILTDAPELKPVPRLADLHRIDRVYRIARFLHGH